MTPSTALLISLLATLYFSTHLLIAALVAEFRRARGAL